MLDADGAEGEQSLRRLQDQAGVLLPPAYQARCEQWRADRAEASLVGSPTWRKTRSKDYHERIKRGLIQLDGEDADQAVERMVEAELAYRTRPQLEIFTSETT